MEYARQNGRKKVTAVHKANIMKHTDGLFLATARKAAQEFADIEFEDRIVDNMCMQLVQKPELYDVLVLPNLYGDILSDLAAGLVGGLGVAPGANIGPDAAVFEATHGSAPKYKGQNKVNPTALILSAVLMLRHLHETEAADRLEAGRGGGHPRRARRDLRHEGGPQQPHRSGDPGNGGGHLPEGAKPQRIVQAHFGIPLPCPIGYDSRPMELAAGGPPNCFASRRGLVLLAVGLAAVVFVYPLLLASSIPLLDPDEGLHAAIAQEMVERGDWIVPRLQGKPFLDKPILYFWAEAASLKLFGMSEGAVRLPGLLLGMLGMAATGIAGGRMFGRAAGWLAAIFYASMVLPVALTQAAAHDVALVPWVAFATLLLWEAERASSPRKALAGTIAAGAFLGLALLTKGLVGVAMVAAAHGGGLLLTRRLRPAACLRGAAAAAVAVAVAAAWYIAVERRCPEYLQYYFLDRHFKGFVTATQPHGRMPWWYYLPILLGGGLALDRLSPRRRFG